MTAADICAVENMDSEFQAQLARYVGLDVILVSFETGRFSPVWQVNELGRQLGDRLEKAGCGAYDSTASGHGCLACFYHVSRLPVALETLKAALEEMALLPLAQILVAEPETRKFRQYWPATAALM
jgi:hypothetical protein